MSGATQVEKTQKPSSRSHHQLVAIDGQAKNDTCYIKVIFNQKGKRQILYKGKRRKMTIPTSIVPATSNTVETKPNQTKPPRPYKQHVERQDQLTIIKEEITDGYTCTYYNMKGNFCIFTLAKVGPFPSP